MPPRIRYSFSSFESFSLVGSLQMCVDHIVVYGMPGLIFTACVELGTRGTARPRGQQLQLKCFLARHSADWALLHIFENSQLTHIDPSSALSFCCTCCDFSLGQSIAAAVALQTYPLRCATAAIDLSPSSHLAFHNAPRTQVKGHLLPDGIHPPRGPAECPLSSIRSTPFLRNAVQNTKSSF
jgi:hypothetical protein